MYCPKCRKESHSIYRECPECGVALVDALPSEPAPNSVELGTALVAPDTFTLMVAKSRLEAEGIRCFTKNDLHGIYDGAVGFGVHELYVPAADVDRAKRLLDSCALPDETEEWETQRCLIREVGPEALQQLATIFADNAEAVRSQEGDCRPENMASALLNHEALPPDGDPDQEHTYLITDKDRGIAIGLLSTYGGYPQPETLYIGSLFLKREWQRRGIGGEIIVALESRSLQNGFAEVRVQVSLKNWPALRFWVRVGYDRITTLTVDEQFAKDAYGSIELTRSLWDESPEESSEDVPSAEQV
jgi:GNAT superfamily N-acetyltransferase